MSLAKFHMPLVLSFCDAFLRISIYLGLRLGEKTLSDSMLQGLQFTIATPSSNFHPVFSPSNFLYLTASVIKWEGTLAVPLSIGGMLNGYQQI